MMWRFWRVVLVLAAIIVVVAVGGFLALQRPDIPYATLEARYANGASRFMDFPGGVRVHYRDQGNRHGPVLVMVHGFSASLEAWEPWVARLAPDYRIVTLDLPGHGLTRAPTGYAASVDGYADIVDEVARRLKLGPCVIIGNSMGGSVAWDLALRHASDVRGVVLVDATGWPELARGGGGEPVIFRMMRNPIGRALLRKLDNRPMAASGLKAAYLNPTLVTPALIDRYVDLSRAPGHRDILLTIQTRTGAPVSASTFKQIVAPTLVMWGEKDALIPVADADAFAQAIPGARLIIYPRVGHVPMEQIPGRSAADLKVFLAELGKHEAKTP